MGQNKKLETVIFSRTFTSGEEFCALFRKAGGVVAPFVESVLRNVFVDAKKGERQRLAKRKIGDLYDGKNTYVANVISKYVGEEFVECTIEAILQYILNLAHGKQHKTVESIVFCGNPFLVTRQSPGMYLLQVSHDCKGKWKLRCCGTNDFIMHSEYIMFAAP